jgi:hypothetical protein
MAFMTSIRIMIWQVSPHMVPQMGLVLALMSTEVTLVLPNFQVSCSDVSIHRVSVLRFEVAPVIITAKKSPISVKLLMIPGLTCRPLW